LNSPDNQDHDVAGGAGERSLIDRIRARVPPAPPGVLVGIGDDAAVAETRRGTLQVLTTDALVEGVHFDFRWSSPFDVGYRALAVNVSDVAAMGGAPHLALLSLILPAGTPLDTIDGLLDGVLAMADAARCGLVGGNIARSPGPLVVDVLLTGSVRPRKVLLRSGGRPGDELYVTGTIGAAAAGLAYLRAALDRGAAPDVMRGTPEDDSLAECVRRYRAPEPRTRVGALLGRNKAASACVDLSDGLADAVTQLAAASGTGARIDASALPIHPAARTWFTSRGEDPLVASVAGGDDYELLFAVPTRRRGRLRTVVREARGLAVTRIGELTADRRVVIARDGREEPLPAGFVHF
jgi:thiamine-monophosphate kinase